MKLLGDRVTRRKAAVAAALATTALLVGSLIGNVVSRAPSGKGSFFVTCNFTGATPVDPIVFPGQFGASHMHEFFGNTVTENTTAAGLAATPGVCTSAGDRSAYWIPTLILPTGQEVTATDMNVYYISHGTQNVVPFPDGWGIVGDLDITYSCGTPAQGGLGYKSQPYDCGPLHDKVFSRLIVFLPNCWNGLGGVIHNTRAGADPNVVPPAHSGLCPKTHPIALPRIQIDARFKTVRSLVGATLSSGPLSTMHADFFNAWQPQLMQTLITRCINKHVECSHVITEPGPPFP